MAPRPVLITIGMVGSALGGIVLLVVILAAAANFGHFSIEDETVTGRELLSRVGIFMVVGALIFLAIAYAVLTDRPWSRHLMLFFWLIVGAGAIGNAIRGLRDGDGFHIDLTWGVAFALAWWYLFRSRDTASYYRQLEREDTHAETMPQPASKDMLDPS